MDFLALAQSKDSFSQIELRSSIDGGFHRARIEAMPDNSLRAPARWRPPAPAAGTPEAGTPAAVAPDSGVPEDERETPLDAAQAERIRQQAFEEGLAQGRREGAAQAQAQLQPQIEGARHEGLQQLRALLNQVGEAVHSLRQQPDTLHEPLKRLALHLAEELVLGELRLGAEAIDRLVQRCVDAVDGQGASQLVVELNPADLQLLQQHPDAEADRPQGWVWQASEQLLPGSVRVRLNEAVVSDFIEHRLHGLAKQLLGEPQRWAAQSAFVPDKLAERRRQAQPVEDAQPRMGAAPAPAPDTASGERLPAWAQAAAEPLAPEPLAPEPLGAALPPSDLLELDASAPEDSAPPTDPEDGAHA